MIGMALTVAGCMLLSFGVGFSAGQKVGRYTRQRLIAYMREYDEQYTRLWRSRNELQQSSEDALKSGQLLLKQRDYWMKRCEELEDSA